MPLLLDCSTAGAIRRQIPPGGVNDSLWDVRGNDSVSVFGQGDEGIKCLVDEVDRVVTAVLEESAHGNVYVWKCRV